MSNKKIILVILAVLLVGAALYFLRVKNTPERTEVTVTEEHEHRPHNMAEMPEKAPVMPVEENEGIQAEFNNTIKALPTLDDLKNLSDEEVHHTPEMIREAGEMIGELIDKADKDPTRREDTVKFLKSCAEEEDVLPQLRALCWNKTLNQITEWNVFVPVTDAKVPEDIKALGSQL